MENHPKSLMILKKKNFLRLLFGILATSLVIIIFFVFLFFADKLSFNPYSYFSAINLSEEKIEVNSTQLNIFDTFVKSTNTSQEIKVSKLDGTILLDKVIPGRDFPKATIFVNSVEKYCFFSADVSSYYYETETLQNTLVNLAILDESGDNLLETSLDIYSNIYIFPGEYSSKNLPQFLENKKLIGIYPIRCEILNNTEEQNKVVEFYKNFDSAEQRDFYFAQTNPIKEQLQ